MIFKQERQKQREFFEKQKMKSKLKLLELSHSTNATLSLDVLNLHVINRISKKKQTIDQHPQHVEMCKRQETFSDVKSVQLPMSPITVPSKICLDDSEIILSETNAKRWGDENSHINSPKKKPKYNEMDDLTNEAKSRSECHKKQLISELEPRSVHCLYDKCTSDNNSNILSSERMAKNKEKLMMQHNVSHFSTLRRFEVKEDAFPNVHKFNNSRKRDVSVQCNLAQEHMFLD